MAAGPLEPGDPRVLGEYRVVGRLGEGGQGIVYEGRSPDGARVAIKVLRGGTDPAIRRRLVRELESARRVAPFCTARVLAAEIDRPDPYVVSEFVAGPSLQERVRDGGPLREGDLDRLAVGTASALAAIHAAGVVHRDFKPANVLLGPDGPRVVDFGIAQPADAGTVSSVLSGTPPYMAPEQLNGVYGSPAADVFSWAATMVYAATGRSPFAAATVAAILQRILTDEPDLTGVPPALREVLAACLAKDPRLRPSARALLVRLVDPGAPMITFPGIGPVPADHLPPGWAPHPDRPAAGAGAAGGPPPGAPQPAGPGYGPAPTRRFGDAGPPGPGAAAGTRPAAERLTEAGGIGTFTPRGGPAAHRRRSAVLIAIAGVAAAFTAAATLYVTGVLGGEGATGQTASGATADPDSGTSTGSGGGTDGAAGPGEIAEAGREPSAAASASSARGVPASFAGTWTGQVVSQDDRQETTEVTIILVQDRRTGTWRTGDCEQQATLTRIRNGDTLDLSVAQRGQCVGGDMTLTLKDPASLDFVGQEGGGSLEYRGVLRRS